MRDALILELEKFNAPASLADIMLQWSDVGTLAWLAHQLAPKKHIGEALYRIADICERTEVETTYAYYKRFKVPVSRLERRAGFEFVINRLLVLFDNRDFWESYVQYAYDVAESIAIGEALIDGVDAGHISRVTGLSMARVYRIRRRYAETKLTRRTDV